MSLVHRPDQEESGSRLARSVAVLLAAAVVTGLAVNAIGLSMGSRRALAWVRTERAMGSLEAMTEGAGDSLAAPPAATTAPPLSATAPSPAPESHATTPAPARPAGATATATPPPAAGTRAVPSTSGPAAATGTNAAPGPAAGLPAIPDSRDPIEIQLANARRFHQAGAALFVDARSAEEYAAGHIAGAINVPFDEAFKNPKLVSGVESGGRPIIVYCGGGDCEASKNLAYSLLDAGRKKVLVFTDGIPAWESAGYPVARGTTP